MRYALPLAWLLSSLTLLAVAPSVLHAGYDTGVATRLA